MNLISDQNVISDQISQASQGLALLERKMGASENKRAGYHHGDLRRVVVETSVAVLEERGVEGFSLREVARRAAVAPAAPAHHFRNVTGLLTAVAASGFERLAAAFDRAMKAESDPTTSLIAMCQAYVRFCLQNPGIASIMFRWELLDNEDEQLAAVRPHTLEQLQKGVREATSPSLPDARIEALAKILWSTMHGLVVLRLDAAGGLEERAEGAVRCILAGAEDGLDAV